MESNDKKGLPHIASGIFYAIDQIKKKSDKFGALPNNHSAYWTYIGVLSIPDKDSQTSYFFHNNGTIFVLDTHKVGVVKDSFISIDGWELSCIEMHHGLMVRSIMSDDNVPDMRKLQSMGEKNMNRLLNMNKEILWVIEN